MADSRRKPDAPEPAPKKSGIGAFFSEIRDLFGKIGKAADKGVGLTDEDLSKQSRDLLNKDDNGPKGPRPGGYGSTKK